MKTVVVFGSGHVARPAIRTLLELGYKVLVATNQPETAHPMVEGFAHGEVIEVDVTNSSQVQKIVRRGDLAISLLPRTFHVLIAEACLKEKRHFITTSYVSDEMRGLHGAALRADLLFLNEIGADPGIDHMQAMKLVHAVQNEGGRVTGISSVCGGLPAPEANDNPLGYKISWSPGGVAQSGRRRARYLENGKVVHVGPFEIFDRAREVEIDGLGKLESYANGDSLRFVDEYALSDLRTLFRGTLRWPGWCETWAALSHLGWVDDAPDAALIDSTYADEMRRTAGGANEPNVRTAVARVLKLPKSHSVLDRLEWLGLFESAPVPAGSSSRIDLLAARMATKLSYREKERDMLALHHEIDFEDRHGKPGKYRSVMIEYGIPGGDSAMARTVGIPAAFAAHRALDGSIRLRGVRIPVHPEIYQPVLGDLATCGIQDKTIRV